jgi:hypothetical protein
VITRDPVELAAWVWARWIQREIPGNIEPSDARQGAAILNAQLVPDGIFKNVSKKSNSEACEFLCGDSGGWSIMSTIALCLLLLLVVRKPHRAPKVKD